MSKKTNITYKNESISHNDLFAYSLIDLFTCKRVAFTMAEILLSLTIIGVVAAITLPSLMANINERTWNTQRKALYARMSQAIAMMPTVGGYGKLAEDVDGNVTEDTAAEAFLTEGLSKVLKINNICDSEHIADCGIPTTFTNTAGSTKTFPKNWQELNSQMVNAEHETSTYTLTHSLINANVAAFETANGENIAVFYQPNCQSAEESNKFYMIQPKICANFIFDMNGTKGPNTIGKDMGFMSVLYPTESLVVAPQPVLNSMTTGDYDTLIAHCRTFDNARLPIREELASMFVNKIFLKYDTNNFVSATTHRTDIDAVYHLFFQKGVMGAVMKTTTNNTGWCVKRN